MLFDKEKEIVGGTNDKLTKYTQLSLYETQVEAMKTDINGIISKMNLATEDLKEVRTISDAIDSKLKNKVNITDFREKTDEIWKEFPKYTSYANLERLKQKIGKLYDHK